MISLVLERLEGAGGARPGRAARSLIPDGASSPRSRWWAATAPLHRRASLGEHELDLVASGRFSKSGALRAERFDDGVLRTTIDVEDGERSESIVWLGDLHLRLEGGAAAPQPSVQPLADGALGEGGVGDGQGVEVRWAIGGAAAALRFTVLCRPSGGPTFVNESLRPDVLVEGERATLRPYDALPAIEITGGRGLRFEPDPYWYRGVPVLGPSGSIGREDRFCPGTLHVAPAPGARELRLQLRVVSEGRSAPARRRADSAGPSPSAGTPQEAASVAERFEALAWAGRRAALGAADPFGARVWLESRLSKWSDGGLDLGSDAPLWTARAAVDALMPWLNSVDAALITPGSSRARTGPGRTDRHAAQAGTAGHAGARSAPSDPESAEWARIAELTANGLLVLFRRLADAAGVRGADDGLERSLAGLTRWTGESRPGTVSVESSAILIHVLTRGAGILEATQRHVEAAVARSQARSLRRWFQGAFWLRKPVRLRDLAVVEELGEPVLTLETLSLRPHMLIAASLAETPLDRAQVRGVVRAIEGALVTPFGLRTLDPEAEGFDPSSLERGAAWPWLFGPLVSASIAGFGYERGRARALSHLVNGLGSMPQAWGSRLPRDLGGDDGDQAFGARGPALRPLGALDFAPNRAEAGRVRSLLGGHPE